MLTISCQETGKSHENVFDYLRIRINTVFQILFVRSTLRHSLDKIKEKKRCLKDLYLDLRGTFFYVRRKVDLMKTAKVNAYIMHIFRKIELLSIHAT